MKKEVRQVDARQMTQRWPRVDKRYVQNKPKEEEFRDGRVWINGTSKTSQKRKNV